MNPVSSPLLLPLTFKEHGMNALHSAFHASEPSASSSTCFKGANSSTNGLAIGCTSGDVFLFSARQREAQNISAAPVPPPLIIGPKPASPPPSASRHSYSHSRSGSPSSLFSQPPFNVSSRSRIVSGLNKEYVEAPKNYVDFEDEPGKLKDMLKGKPAAPRDREVSEASSIRSLSPPITNSQLKDTQTQRKKDEVRSLLSATNTPLTNAKLSLPPTSPSKPIDPPATEGVEGDNLHLQCQVISPHRTAVADLCTIDDVVITLYTPGDIIALDGRDGRCFLRAKAGSTLLRPPAGIPDTASTQSKIWQWTRLKRLVVGEATLVFALAKSDKDMSFDGLAGYSPGVQSRVIAYEYRRARIEGLLNAGLKAVGDWTVNANVHDIWIGSPTQASTFSLFYINEQLQLVCQDLLISPQPLELPSQQPPMTPQTHPTHVLPNPFKNILPKAEEAHNTEAEYRPLGRITLVEEIISGVSLPENLPSKGLSMVTLNDSTVFGVVWTASDFMSFEYIPSNKSGRALCTTEQRRIQSCSCTAAKDIFLVFKDRVEYHKLELENPEKPCHTLVSMADPGRGFHYSVSNGWITVQKTSSSIELKQTSLESGLQITNLWQSTLPEPVETRRSTILAQDMSDIIVGYGNGGLRKTSFDGLIDATSHNNKSEPPGDALNGYIISLHRTRNHRTGEELVVGGADDGSIAFWSPKTCELKASWVLFNTRLQNVLNCDASEERLGPLRGCVLCISVDSAVAVIAVDGFQFLYLIPAAGNVALKTISIDSDDLMLTYANGRTRAWDLNTKEFRRSMTAAKAQEMLATGDWFNIDLQAFNPESRLLTPIGVSYLPQYASCLALNLEAFISESTRTAKGISTNKHETGRILSARNQLQSILSVLISPTTSSEIDWTCYEKLGLRRCCSSVAIGSSSSGSFSLYDPDHVNDPWCISPDVSAARLLAIAVTLRALQLFQELFDDCSTVLAHHANSRALSSSPMFQPPSIVYLARRWFDGSNEIRSASKILLEGMISRLSDEEAMLIVEQWQQALPCMQESQKRREGATAALALFLCGFIATERYTVLSPSSLADIAKSIDTYLHDEHSAHRVLAIELCSHGFHIWQSYVDAMGILRALFTLGTSVRKENISAQNSAPSARLAVLQIASSNTPLFITTLGLDILNPSSMEYRKSVLQIVAFLIRKRPLVLLPNLPRLLEAVVKSLDPNSTANRDAILDTATEILGHVVKTFPTVDFHMNTQKLAVGTSEGALIMYDLKTATRLYVLEGHKERISACSLSPDGRRLVTMSLEEGVTLVWKVGSSFSSFFNPGAPPRQGHGGSEPFRTIPFNVGDEADMSVADTLEFIQFEWPSDRSVRLKIRQSVLTFST